MSFDDDYKNRSESLANYKKMFVEIWLNKINVCFSSDTRQNLTP